LGAMIVPQVQHGMREVVSPPIPDIFLALPTRGKMM
jgi:hypothetical protein